MLPKQKRKALTAAERQRKRREKLKKEGGYEEYKARHRKTVRMYRMKQAEQLKSITEERKPKLLKKEEQKIS